MNRFLLSNDPDINWLKNIGFHNGKKLEQLMLFINNTNSAVDFNLSLFNPSEPLDYLYATSQNINDKITVAGGNVLYTDVLYNMLGNPLFIRNVQVFVSGADKTTQKTLPLLIEDKCANGITEVKPINMNVQLDIMQVDGDMVSFRVKDVLERPFVPDGMDVINYTVKAGNTVRMCFYYEQKALKKLMYPDARYKRTRIDSK
jgi:hypothetical protein